MAFARYPIGKSKKSSDSQFYISTDNITIDLNTLYMWMIKINQILTYTCSYLEDINAEMTSLYNEAMSEYI